MRQAKEDNKRTKLVREIPYIDSKDRWIRQRKRPPPIARSKSNFAYWNQQTERDRLKKSTPDREF